MKRNPSHRRKVRHKRAHKRAMRNRQAWDLATHDLMAFGSSWVRIDSEDNVLHIVKHVPFAALVRQKT